jgi:peptide/nickel transport system substrate-binding protein
VRTRFALLSVILLVGVAIAGQVFATGQKDTATSTSAAPASDVLRVGVAEDVANYDPAADSYLLYRNVYRLLIFDRLLEYNTESKLAGQLAKSWELKGDRTYIFHLQQGVKFHNGKSFDANDVKYSIDRINDPKTGSYLAADMDVVKSVSVLDQGTVEIVLKGPSVAFLDSLTTVSIVPNDPSVDLKTRPVGTGPYKLTDYVANDRIVFTKNSEYWRSGLPHFKTIQFKIIPNEQVMVTNLVGGNIDMIPVASAASIFDALKAFPNYRVEASKGSTDLMFFDVNASAPPLSNVLVRRAMAMCFDYEAYRKIAFSGHGDITNSPLLPFMFGYTDVGLYKFDPAKAKGVLREAGYPDGFTVTIRTLAGYPRYLQMAEIWRDGLAKAGVTAKVSVEEAKVWLNNFVTHNYEITINETATRIDPYSAFNTTVLRDNLQGFFPNPADIVERMSKPNTIVNDQQRAEAYKSLQKWFFDELPGIFIFLSPPTFTAVTNRLEGLFVNPMGEYYLHSARFK